MVALSDHKTRNTRLQTPSKPHFGSIIGDRREVPTGNLVIISIYRPDLGEKIPSTIGTLTTLRWDTQSFPEFRRFFRTLFPVVVTKMIGHTFTKTWNCSPWRHGMNGTVAGTGGERSYKPLHSFLVNRVQIRIPKERQDKPRDTRKKSDPRWVSSDTTITYNDQEGTILYRRVVSIDRLLVV